MGLRTKMTIVIAGITLILAITMVAGAIWLNNRYFRENINQRFHLASDIVIMNLTRKINDQLNGYRVLSRNRLLTREVTAALSDPRPKRMDFFGYFIDYAGMAKQYGIQQASIHFISAANPDMRVFGVYENGRTFSFAPLPNTNGKGLIELEIGHSGLILPKDEDMSGKRFSLPIAILGRRLIVGLISENRKLYVDLNIPLVNQTIGGAKEKSKGFAYPGLTYGVIRSFSELSPAWLKKLEKDTGVHLDIHLPDGKHALGSLISDLPLTRTGGEDAFYRSLEGESFISAARSIYYKNQQLGYLVMSVPNAYLWNQTFETALTLSAIGLAVFVILLFAAWIILFYFTRPINKLEKVADQLSKGNLSYPIDVRGNDEIGRLAGSFVKMRDAIRLKMEDLNVINDELQSTKNQLEDFNQELEQQVKQRTEELWRILDELDQQSTQLEKAKEEAESSNRSKSLFLASMSHEIRTPLNAVIGLAEHLVSTDLTSEQRDFIQAINTSGEQLLSIINDILDFSKIEANQLQLETISFDLVDYVEDILKMMGYSAHEKGLELACRFEPGVYPYRIGDPTRLQQIFVNLIGNAIKFTHQGEILLEVTVDREKKHEDWLNFVISDTGVGIAENKLEDIFNSFSQADMSTTRKYGGTGLGLAISRKLVQLMGGDIAAQSTQGKGSRFSFSIPLPRGENFSASNKNNPAELIGKHVLIVANNPTTRLIYSEIFKQWESRVVEADSGVSAIELMKEADRKAPFDLVLLDYMMPEMDGIQTVREINGINWNGKPAIILLTSSDISDSETGFDELGLAGQMKKPTKRSDLLKKVLQAIGQRSEPVKTIEKNEQTIETPLNVLVAEDIPANQRIIEIMFKDQPIAITLADNGLSAVEQYKNDSFDVVLMDIEMPEMDGYEATRLIRRWEDQNAKKAAPVIAVTAHAFKEQIKACYEAGCSDVLTKPLRKEVLIQKIRDLTQKPFPPENGSRHPDGRSHQKAVPRNRTVVSSHLEELMPDFFRDIQQAIVTIKEALDKNDFEAVRKLGHGFKGAARNHELDELSELFLAIEESAVEHHAYQIRSTLVEILDYLAQVKIKYRS